MFESFFDWADEQGLPFRSWADGLQEKGIPPAVLVLIPLLLIGGAAFLFLNQAPATGSVVISATTFAGEPLPGVSVTLTNVAKFKASATTDASGKASFEKVPVGKVNVNAFSSTVALQESNFDLTVKAGATVRKSVSASLQEAQGVELRVDVQAADAPTLTLLDANGDFVEKVAESTSYSFAVAKNTEYVIKAEQDGFLPDERRVLIGESNEYVTLTPQEKGKAPTARLHVRVVRAGVGGEPVGNASVRVFQGEALIRSAESSDDGSVPPLQVALNSSLRILVDAAGFEQGALDVNVSRQDQTASVALTPLQPSFSGVRITVKDVAGNVVYSPIVRLYSGTKLLGEQLPDEGVAIFNVSWSSALGVSVYKSGHLPVFVANIKKDQLVVLESSDNRSARVRVHVTDHRGNDAVRASVLLWGNASRPLGIPARLTDVNGIQVFDDIPLRPLVVIASDGVRSKSSGVFEPASDGGENGTLVELQFDPIAVPVSISVLDHFSRQPIANAKVASSNESCTTNVKGTCSLRVLESDAAAFTVSASGYSTLETASLSVYPGVPAFTFDLTPEAVVRNVRLRFDGVFDASGRKVNALSPLSEYEARYAIVSPGVDFAKAEAFVALDGDAVLLGGASSGARVSKGDVQTVSAVADVPPVSVNADGFSLPSFEVEQGSSVVFVNDDNVTHIIVFDDGQSVTIPEGQNRSVVFNQIGGFAFKSMRNAQLSGFVTVSAKAALDVADASNLLFEYGPFNGTRQITARFRTGTTGEVVLSHRSAFFTSIETLRSPLDGVSETGRFKIDFAGTCTEQVCVQWYFTLEGKKASRLELPFGQKASLVVNVFGLGQNGVVGVAPGTPALKVLSGTTNASVAVLSGSGAQLRVGSGASSSEFSFQAVRLSQDASLKINVSDGRLLLFEADAFVVVYSPTQPALSVSVKPNRVDALESSKVVFTLKDSLGQAVQGARVTLQDVEAAESEGAAGQYVVDEIRPESLAAIPFEVTKDGFRPFTGSISVDAPENAVDVTPASVVLNVDSKEPASSSIQVSNKLADKLRASISVTIDAGGDITDVSTSTTSLSLPARGSASFDLEAAIKESVLQLASKAGQLKEKVRGTIHVRVSGKGFSETRDVPFSIDSVFSQSAITDAWTLTPDSLQFNLEPPRDKTASLEMTVANNGPYPMVFNLEQTLGLSVQPASLTVAPGSQDTFSIKAFLPREIDCFSQDLQKRGALSVHGSFQGISSKKTAQINLDVSTARMACQPPNGYRIILPVDIRLEFLANARMKTNPDGSTSVLLPTRELLWFGTGASVTPIDAQVPENTAFVLDRRYVQPLPEGGWTITFPTAVTLQLPSDADYQPFGSGQTIVTLDNAQIILPPGVQTPQRQPNVRLAAAGVRVPPLQPVTFRRIPFNYDALQNVLPADPVEIKLPTDATLDLLPGTVERKIVQPKSNPLSYLPKPQAEQNLQNLKSIQLPSGERMAFGDSVGIDLPQLRLTLPAGTSLFVSRSRVNAVKNRPIEEAFELRMPVSYALSVQGTPKSFKTQEGKNALKLTDEAVVEASWALTVSKQQSQSVLRVARDNALTFLTRASARIPYDPASVAKCSFTYAPPSSVAFSLPTGTVVQKTDKGYEAVLPACDDSSRIVFSVTDSSSGTLEVFQSPSVKKIVFAADSEFTVGDASDAEEKSIRTTDAIELTACLKDAAGKDVAETLREAKVSFAENSLVSMPERVLGSFKENQAEVDFGVLTPVSLGSKSGALTQLGRTKKMTIHPNGQKVTAALVPAYPASGLLMPKGSALSFLPVCEKGSGRLDVSTSAEDVYVALDKDGKTGVLEVTFSNKNPESFRQTKDICIFNNGKQSVTLTGVHAEPAQSVAAEHTDYFKAIAGAVPPDTTVPSEKAYFSQGVDGKRQRINIESSTEGKDNCRRMTVELKLPVDLLHKDKCIKPNAVPPSMEGQYRFTFNDVNGDPVADSEKHRLPVKMIFDAKEEDCQAVQEEQQFRDLTGISVNFDSKELSEISSSGEDKLYFKDAGHTRYFAIVNNEEKPVSVKELRGDGVPLMTCTRVGDSSAGFALQAGAQIGPADTMLLSCVSNPASAGKQGQYIIDFSGDSYRLEKIVNVHVWDPGALRHLYPFTPMGHTVPFFDASQATVKEKGKLEVAPLKSLAFADPVAPGTSSGATSTAPTGAATTPEPVAETVKTNEQKQADAKTQQQANLAQARNLLDFRLCKKFFCTGTQADLAIHSFTDIFRKMIDQRLVKDGQAVEMSGLQAFCTQLESDGQTAFTKSMLLQLTNVELSKDNSITQSLALGQDLKTKYFSDIKEVRVTSTGTGSVLFSGCGIYRVTARLDPACGIKGTTPAEWKNNMRLEVQIAKLQSCDVHLANAALLTAETPYAYSGNRLGEGTLTAFRQAFFSKETWTAIGALPGSVFASNDNEKIRHVFENIGRLRQGVLGRYGSEPNAIDQQTAKHLYSSLYGADTNKKEVQLCPGAADGFKNTACPATYYEDQAFCWRTGTPVVSTLTGSIAAIVALQSSLAFASAPVGGPPAWAFTARALATNYRLIGAFSGCVAGAGAESFQGRSAASCRALDICTSTLLASTFEMMPVPYNVGLTASQRLNLAQSTTRASVGSAFSAAILQSAIGAGIITGTDALIGGTEPQHYPTVPITILVRQLSPDRLERGAVALYRINIANNPLASARTKRVEEITKALEAYGLYGPQGRRTAGEVARVLAQAAENHGGDAYANALVRAISRLEGNQANAFQAVADANPRGAVASLADDLARKDPAFAQHAALSGLGLGNPDVGNNYGDLERFFNGLNPAVQDAVFAHEEIQAYKFKVPAHFKEEEELLYEDPTDPNKLTGRKIKRIPVDEHFLTGRDALAYARNPPVGAPAIDPNPLEIFRAGNPHQGASPAIAKILQEDPNVFALNPNNLIRGVPAYQQVQLREHIARFTPPQQADFIAQINGRIEDPTLRLAPNAFTRGADSVANEVVDRLQNGHLPFNGLAQTVPGLPTGFGGLRGVMELQVDELPGRNFGERLRRAFSLQQMRLRDGTLRPITEDFAETSRSQQAQREARQGVQAAIKAEEKANRVVRTGTAFAALASAFLFNTDFRPVQIQVDSHATNAHIIAVHTENGVASAESICIQGVADECKTSGGQSPAGVLSIQQLCGSSSVCLRLLQWPSGNQDAYALVVGFNDGVTPSSKLLSSIFAPEVAPLDNTDYAQLKLVSAKIEYAVTTAAGFQQYQLQAADPKDVTRQAQVLLADGIIQRLNADDVKGAVPDDQRKAVQAMANRAKTAFNNQQETQGAALLLQAQAAERQLMSTAKLGG